MADKLFYQDANGKWQPVTDAAPLPTKQVAGSSASASIASGQVALSTGAATLVAARTNRRRVLVKNLDGTITIYVGPATVTSGNGMEVKAGESVILNTTALIQAIAASGTPTAAYVEEYG